MKYICTEQEGGVQEIFIFPRTVNHDAMAEMLERIKDHTTGSWTRISRMPISAGFVTKDGICYGESITLNLESRHQVDADLLAEQHS
ncbi:MAG: hypothetical protein KAT62_03600 [Desulfuromonadales bacterium]|nr:hypothetical protein [Desulfuromonadales bacterium]